MSKEIECQYIRKTFDDYERTNLTQNSFHSSEDIVLICERCGSVFLQKMDQGKCPICNSKNFYNTYKKLSQLDKSDIENIANTFFLDGNYKGYKDFYIVKQKLKKEFAIIEATYGWADFIGDSVSNIKRYASSYLGIDEQLLQFKVVIKESKGLFSSTPAKVKVHIVSDLDNSDFSEKDIIYRFHIGSTDLSLNFTRNKIIFYSDLTSYAIYKFDDIINLETTIDSSGIYCYVIHYKYNNGFFSIKFKAEINFKFLIFFYTLLDKHHPKVNTPKIYTRNSHSSYAYRTSYKINGIVDYDYGIFANGAWGIGRENDNLYFSAPNSLNLDYQVCFDINNIKWFKNVGNIFSENIISGGGGGSSSIGGAIIGGMIAGPTGAIIGSRKKTDPIKSELSIHDDRMIQLEYYYGPNRELKSLFIDKNAYSALDTLIPEKNYEYIMNNGIVESQPQNNNNSDYIELLKQLAVLKEQGILTQEEFESKKADLLNKI